MYLTRLDTIRSYAISMIFFANIFWFENWYSKSSYLFPLGQVGMIIFFIMSGFLITRSLLSEPKNKSAITSIKEFYLRRSLRIFPLYYFFLIICYVLNIGGARQYGLELWFYLSNFHIFNNNSWMGSYSHLWTIALQVQIYLIWPFLILFLRARPTLLLVLFTSLILIAIHTKLALLIGGFSEKQIAAFTISNIDFFAIGALIALGDEYQRNKFKLFGLIPFLVGSAYYQKKLKTLGYMLFAIGIIAYYEFYYLCQYLAENKFFFVISQSLLALSATGLIIISIYSSMAEKNIFHNKYTMHIGKISYGIYLYHYFVISQFSRIASYFGIYNTDQIYIYLKIIVSLILTFALAEISFYLIEKPLFSFKNKFKTE